MGIESNSYAIEYAEKNAADNGVKRVQFRKADAAEIAPQLFQENSPDLVLLNPPRTGLTPELIASLLLKPPKHLIYISCMPSTLARDLHELCKGPYRIQKGYVIDMFPQTAHVETLVHLSC